MNDKTVLVACMEHLLLIGLFTGVKIRGKNRKVNFSNKIYIFKSEKSNYVLGFRDSLL